MKKKYRLKRNEDIASVISKKKYYKNESFIIYSENTTNENIRICISVSKKNGNAVIRNKIKRQVREMLKDIVDFDLKMDMVIVVKHNFLKLSFDKNKENLKYIYSKVIKGETK